MAALLALGCPSITNSQPETGKDRGEFWTVHAKCLQVTSFRKLGF